jgi:hypothetical protein
MPSRAERWRAGGGLYASADCPRGCARPTPSRAASIGKPPVPAVDVYARTRASAFRYQLQFNVGSSCSASLPRVLQTSTDAHTRAAACRYQLISGDDKFMTRWIVSHKWNMSMQVSPECTLATTFKADGKFFTQILRWTRNTWRSDYKSLVLEREIWYRYPVQARFCNWLIGLCFFPVCALFVDLFARARDLVTLPCAGARLNLKLNGVVMQNQDLLPLPRAGACRRGPGSAAH